MNESFYVYANPMFSIRGLLAFIFLFVVFRQVMEQTALYSAATKWIASFCLAALAVLGMGRLMVRLVFMPYTTLGLLLLLLIMIGAGVAAGAARLRRRREDRSLRKSDDRNIY